MRRYFKIWLLFALNSFQIQMNIRWGLALFLLAKILRFMIFTIFIIILLNKTDVLKGYNLDQTILFFLTFNLIDIVTQLLFREVYRFRYVILSGTFDFYLIKPIDPLFRSLITGPDLLDFFTLIPLFFAIIFFINKLDLLNIFSLSAYFFMVLISLLIALSFHILVLCLGIITTAIENLVFLYRDLVSMGRMPVDIYVEPIRGILTFIIPVGIMMSFPAKSLLGLLSPTNYIYAVMFAVTLFLISLKLWFWALKKYSSASS